MKQDNPSVLLITIDSIRDDRSHYLTAKSKELEDDFAEFSAISHGVATPLAFPGIFSGTLARDNGEIPENQETLPEMTNSYSTGFSNNGHLNSTRGYDRGFDNFADLAPPGDESILDQLRKLEWLKNNQQIQKIYNYLIRFYRDSDWYEGNATVPIPYRPASSVVEFGQRILRDNPGFSWIHFMDPHAPYHPDTAVGEVPELSVEELQSLTQKIYSAEYDRISSEEADIIEKLYDGNVRYLAAHLSELLEWCKNQHWYSDSLIAITGDHGELLGEHGEFTHPWDTTPYDELINVPLFVKFPQFDFGGESFAHQVDHSDLHTLLKFYFKRPYGDEKRFEVLLNSKDKVSHSASNSTIRATTSGGAIFRNRKGEVWTEGEVSEQAKEQLQEIQFPNCGNPTQQGPNTGEIEEQLRALGYK